MDKEADEPERAGLHLARNLISLRHARTLTQDAVAAAAGLPRSTIANLESGEANPSLAVLVKIASALGVPIDELLAAPRAKVRKWTAEEIGSRQRGRGVAERPLVPEPTPEGLLYVMDFGPDARLGGTPHLPGTREYFTAGQDPESIAEVCGDLLNPEHGGARRRQLDRQRDAVEPPTDRRDHRCTALVRRKMHAAACSRSINSRTLP